MRQSTITRGKYSGQTMSDLLGADPEWLRWAYEHGFLSDLEPTSRALYIRVLPLLVQDLSCPGKLKDDKIYYSLQRLADGAVAAEGAGGVVNARREGWEEALAVVQKVSKSDARRKNECVLSGFAEDGRGLLYAYIDNRAGSKRSTRPAYYTYKPLELTRASEEKRGVQDQNTKPSSYVATYDPASEYVVLYEVEDEATLFHFIERKELQHGSLH